MAVDVKNRLNGKYYTLSKIKNQGKMQIKSCLTNIPYYFIYILTFSPTMCFNIILHTNMINYWS